MSAGGEATRYCKPASIRLFLAVAASGVFVTVITATMINVLIPFIRAEFGASAASFSSLGSFLGVALAAAGFIWRINGVPHPFHSTFGPAPEEMARLQSHP